MGKAARVATSGLLTSTLGYPARGPASWRRRSGILEPVNLNQGHSVPPSIGSAARGTYCGTLRRDWRRDRRQYPKAGPQAAAMRASRNGADELSIKSVLIHRGNIMTQEEDKLRALAENGD